MKARDKVEERENMAEIIRCTVMQELNKSESAAGQRKLCDVAIRMKS